MDSIREVMILVIVLRIQGPNKSTAKSIKRGPVKGRSHDPQLQILFQLSQELASFSLSCSAMSLTISDWLHAAFSSVFHSGRGRFLPFWLSVGLALSCFIKPPQPGSLVGPVMKSTTIIQIRDRGQGWQWKFIGILIARSSSFCHALTNQLPECGWRKLKNPQASAMHWLVSFQSD